MITPKGTNLDTILTKALITSAIIFANNSFNGARIPAIPPDRKLVILPKCSFILSPAILLPVARDINPPSTRATEADICPNSVIIRSKSISNPSPPGPPTPSGIDCASTGGLIGLVTGFPGSVSSAVDINPRDSSTPPLSPDGVPV